MCVHFSEDSPADLAKKEKLKAGIVNNYPEALSGPEIVVPGQWIINTAVPMAGTSRERIPPPHTGGRRDQHPPQGFEARLAPSRKSLRTPFITVSVAKPSQVIIGY